MKRRSFLVGSGASALGSGAAALGASCAILTDSSAAFATQGGTAVLSAKELARLRQNKAVHRQFEFEKNGHDYLGALSYSGINRSAKDVWDVLNEPKKFNRAWPSTWGAEFEGENLNRIRLHQGTSVVDVRYTIHWHPDPDNYEIRYWMDPDLPSDFDDTFGFFRIQPDGETRSLVTIGVALDPGSSIAAFFFRGMIHDYLVRPAGYLSRYMHKHTPPSQVSRLAKR